MLLNTLDIIGTIAFAISGTLAAQHKHMDIFGVIVIANITAIGGGTLRDLLLGIHPIFWIAEPSVLIIGSLSALTTIFINRESKRFLTLLYISDAVGLAAFVIIGIHRSNLVEATPFIASFMGVLTGIGGGMLRDILCNDVPIVLQKEIYAVAAILGAVVYFGLLDVYSSQTLATLACVATVLFLRMAGIYWRWALPRIKT